jgi:hypothetical protein
MTRVTTPKARNVLLVLLGVAALVMKRHYSGPCVDIVHNHGGNASASFAVYFVISIMTSGWRYGRLLTASIALLVVELFEATNGFGVMTNVYDPVDFVANALGVGLALVVDSLASSTGWRGSDRRRRSAASG